MPNNKPKYWEQIDTVKVAVPIERESYEKIKKKFYHGQMTELIRALIYSIEEKIAKGEILDVIKFIHREKEIVLNVPKKKKE